MTAKKDAYKGIQASATGKKGVHESSSRKDALCPSGLRRAALLRIEYVCSQTWIGCHARSKAKIATENRILRRGCEMFIFKDQVAFVTGGASGIGYSIACALAKRGSKVVLADIDVAQTAKALNDFPGEAIGIKLNVADRENWLQAREETESKLGEVGILINNAGIVDNPLAPIAEREFLDYPYEKWDRMININLAGVANGIKTFGPGMRKNRFGHIVNTSSTQGLIPTAGLAAYSVSKFGVVAITEALRDELAPFDVGVSVLFPGATASRIGINALKEAGLPASESMLAPGLDPAVTAEMVINGIKNNKLYIITHGEYRKYCEDRFARIIAEFTETPASQDYSPDKPVPATREWARDKYVRKV
jgi:NAD(P)-dependent dehydrogenase (short-subunit alcohol dehydrogenase family)